MSNATSEFPGGVTIRNDVRPGDLGAIVHLHGTIYAREYGFDATFEAYVAEPLAVLVRTQSRRDRVWIAERDGRLVGCIAIVGVSDKEAQLRWFLIDRAARGMGLGTHLIREAIGFCKLCGYESVFLWTVRALQTAAHLYHSVGFRKVESNPEKRWGVDVIEERYVLSLAPNIRVQPADPASQAAVAFLAALDEYQASLYPAESNHFLSVAALQQPNVTFLIAEVDGQPAGCGAFVQYGDYAEIKRMFVAHAFRGLKVGRRILDELEARIRALGVTVARLETGVSQPEALGLYEKAGYQRRGPFGAYRDDPLSVFMEKRLA